MESGFCWMKKQNKTLKHAFSDGVVDEGKTI
jgi:hypothetical protein